MLALLWNATNPNLSREKHIPLCTSEAAGGMQEGVSRLEFRLQVPFNKFASPPWMCGNIPHLLLWSAILIAWAPLLNTLNSSWCDGSLIWVGINSWGQGNISVYLHSSYSDGSWGHDTLYVRPLVFCIRALLTNKTLLWDEQIFHGCCKTCLFRNQYVHRIKCDGGLRSRLIPFLLGNEPLT